MIIIGVVSKFKNHEYGSSILHNDDLWVLIPKNATSTLKTFVHGSEVEGQRAAVNFYKNPELLKKNVKVITRDPIKRYISGYLTCIARGEFKHIMHFKDDPFENFSIFTHDRWKRGPQDEHVETQTWFLPPNVNEYIKIESLTFKENHNKNNHPLKNKLYDYLINEPKLLSLVKEIFYKDFSLYYKSK